MNKLENTAIDQYIKALEDLMGKLAAMIEAAKNVKASIKSIDTQIDPPRQSASAPDPQFQGQIYTVESTALQLMAQSFDELRKYASSLGVRNAWGIRGGKRALVEEILKVHRP